MTSRDRILAALACQEPDRVPYADWIDPQPRRALAALLGDPEMDDVRFAKLLGMDALCYADPSVVAPQFCRKIIDDQGVEHLQSEGLIKTEADMDKFILPDLSAPGYFDQAKRYVDENGRADVAIWCSMRTGMMNTVFSMGLMDFSRALFTNVGFIERMLDAYIEWNIRLLEEVERIGFDFITVYDDIAFNSGPIFSPQVFREIFLPRMRTFADAVNIPWVYHTDGDPELIFDDLLTLGFNGFNPFQPPVMDIEAYHDKYSGRFCFWGNIDMVDTLVTGTEQDVENEVKQRLAKLAPGGGYIMASANSITDYLKPELVLAMTRANRKFGRYPIQID